MKPEGRALAVAELLRSGFTATEISKMLEVTDRGGSVAEAMAVIQKAAPESGGELDEAERP